MTHQRAGGVVPVLLVAAFTASFAQTVVIAALPGFGRDLGAATTEVAWVLTAFMLSSAVTSPIAGKLGDLFGYRRVLVACLLCFTAGTVVAALGLGAHSLGLLIAGRAVQGVSGGVFPLAFGIVRTALPPSRVPGVVALLSALFGIGGGVGMVVAGPIADVLGTPWLFWSPLVLVAVALAGAGVIPAERPMRAGRVDLGGAALLSGALVCLLLAISQGQAWGWIPVTGLFAGSAALLAAFAAVELRVPDPLIDLRLMRRRVLATTNMATLAVGAAMFGVITLVPRFVQTPSAAGYGFGSSATGAGLLLVPVALLMLVAVPIAARTGTRFGSRAPLQVGAVSAIAAFVLLAVAHGRLWELYAILPLVGCAYGLAFASVGNLVVEDVEPHRTGMATGVSTIVRTVGGAIGAQLAATILAARTPAGAHLPAESGYTIGFVTFAVVAALAFVLARAIPTASPASTSAEEERPAQWAMSTKRL